MTKHDLKELTNLGAELGAAKAEVERLREALQAMLDECDPMNLNCGEPWCRARAALLPRSEPCGGCGNDDESKRCIGCGHQFTPAPTDTYTAVEMATAAAQGFRDGQVALVEAAQGALAEIQAALEDAYLNAYPECCGQAHLECCGSPLQAWSEADQKIMDRFAPHEKALRHALAAPIAQTAPQGTTSDKYRAELYDEVWEKARSMGYGNVTNALIELERMKTATQPEQSGLVEVLEKIKADTRRDDPLDHYDMVCRALASYRAALSAQGGEA